MIVRPSWQPTGPWSDLPCRLRRRQPDARFRAALQSSRACADRAGDSGCSIRPPGPAAAGDGWTEKRSALQSMADCCRRSMAAVGLAGRFIGTPDIGMSAAPSARGYQAVVRHGFAVAGLLLHPAALNAIRDRRRGTGPDRATDRVCRGGAAEGARRVRLIRPTRRHQPERRARSLTLPVKWPGAGLPPLRESREDHSLDSRRIMLLDMLSLPSPDAASCCDAPRSGGLRRGCYQSKPLPGLPRRSRKPRWPLALMNRSRSAVAALPDP